MRRMWNHGRNGPHLGVSLGLALVLVAVPSCTDDRAVPTDPQFLNQIDRIFLGLGPWPEQRRGVDSLGDTVVTRTQGGIVYTCTETTYKLFEAFNDLVAVGVNAGILWPGALIQGRTVQSGALASVPLPRSPIRISVDLAIDSASVLVSNPSSATVQAAIARLQRQADRNLPEVDVVPTRMTFVRQEAFSFQQAILSAGLSLKYSAGVEASLSADFTSQRSLRAHTIIVRLYQPMYTVSFADEEKPLPSDFFPSSIDEDDVEDQIRSGTIGESNLPTYVKSVTYGRMMLFTMTSTEVQSALELSVAVAAVVGAFSGDADVGFEQNEILSNSTIQMTAFGGTQDAAMRAIRTGDLNEFFVPAPASTAVPLSYRINNLSDRSVAVIGDNTEYTVSTCSPEQAYRFEIKLDSIRAVSNCAAEATRVVSSVDDSLVSATPLVLYDSLVSLDSNSWINPGRVAFVNRRTASDSASFAIESKLMTGTPGPSPNMQDRWEALANQQLDTLQLGSTRMLTVGVLSIGDLNGELTGTATTTVTFQISPPPDQRRCSYSVTGRRTGFEVNIALSTPLPESDNDCTTLASRGTFAFSGFSGIIDSATSIDLRVRPVRLGGTEDREIIFRRVGSPRMDPSRGSQNDLVSRFSRPFALPGGASTAPVTHIFGAPRVNPGEGQCSVEFRYTVIRTPVFLIQHPDGRLTYEPIEE